MITLRDAKDRTLRRMSIASGLDVQVYAEEPLTEIINHKITAIFDLAWWPQYMNSETLTLLAGIVQSDLSTKLKGINDLRFVYLGSCPDPLPRLASYVNPSAVYLPSVVADSDATKVFKVIGNFSDTSCTIVYRKRPDPVSADDDQILMDDQLIILGSAYDYLNSLGTGTGEEDKLLQMFQSRLNTVMAQIDQMVVSSLNYGAPRLDWQEVY